MLDFVKDHDMFVYLPSSYSKSICFTLLPLIFDHLRGKSGSITLVISSSMLDQRYRFIPKGLSTDLVGELQQDLGSITSSIMFNCFMLVLKVSSVMCS